MDTPEESDPEYNLEDISIGVNPPPADIDDERTRKEAAYYETQAKGMGNIGTAARINAFNRFFPILCWFLIVWYAVVGPCVLLAALHWHGMSIDIKLATLLLGGPVLLAGIMRLIFGPFKTA